MKPLEKCCNGCDAPPHKPSKVFCEKCFSELDDKIMKTFGKVVYSYTRAQAIKDGVLVDLTDIAPDLCVEHYKHPIACTSAVWIIIEKAVSNKRYCNDLCGVIHDILWMSRKNVVVVSDINTVLFEIIIKGAGRKSKYRFKMVCGPGDDAKPVITIMLPDED